MSEDTEDHVHKGDETAPETSDVATTAEVPVPPEAVLSDSGDVPPATPEPEPQARTDGAADEAPAPPPTVETAGTDNAGALLKVDVSKRIVAALIDFAIAYAVGLVPGVGQLLGAGYLILRDGLELDFMNHRSIGKHVMKLHLASVDGQPLELMTSVKRNWIFAIGPLVPLLLLVPILGWMMLPFAAFAAFALGITELVLALTDDDGRRLGDKWAGTMVVED